MGVTSEKVLTDKCLEEVYAETYDYHLKKGHLGKGLNYILNQYR